MGAATNIITTTVGLMMGIFGALAPLVDPTNVNATFLTYLIDLGIIVPIALWIFRGVKGLAGGRGK